MRQEVLRLDRVTFLEQGFLQLEDFTLNLFAGEIMGLLAVDSHGLGPLIHLLRYNLPIKHGEVYYREERINSWSAPNPRHNPIGIIQSESCLVDGLTVAENVFVLRPGFRGRLIRSGLLRRQLQPFLEQIHVDISAGALVEQLTAFQRCVVEMLKSVVAGNRVILLRDVGTYISESELAQLHEILRYYAAQGLAFLYVGFHFEELSRICDRTALFLNGRITKVLKAGEGLSHCADSYDRMVRRQMSQRLETHRAQEPVLRVSHLSGGAVKDLSFQVAPGECLVLQDLNNRIFEDLLKLFLGDLRPAQGGLWLDGAPYRPGPTRQIAVLRERPSTSMLFSEMSYMDNLCFTLDHRLPELWRSRRVHTGLKKACAQWFGDESFGCRPEFLSKAQKYDLVYHRVMLQNPKVAFCIQPFNGADMELRMHIWHLLQSLLARGIAVVVLAVNLADSLSLADRLIRVRQDAPDEVYERKEFADLPFSAPFLNLYREEMKTNP